MVDQEQIKSQLQSMGMGGDNKDVDLEQLMKNEKFQKLMERMKSDKRLRDSFSQMAKNYGINPDMLIPEQNGANLREKNLREKLQHKLSMKQEGRMTKESRMKIESKKKGKNTQSVNVKPELSVTKKKEKNTVDATSSNSTKNTEDTKKKNQKKLKKLQKKYGQISTEKYMDTIDNISDDRLNIEERNHLQNIIDLYKKQQFKNIDMDQKMDVMEMSDEDEDEDKDNKDEHVEQKLDVMEISDEDEDGDGDGDGDQNG